MKKLFSKIELKPLLISIGLVLSQSIFYFTSKLFQSNFHVIGNFIDERIPFNSIAIIPYCLWHLLIFFVPYYLYLKDKKELCKYIASYILCAFIAAIIFAVYPTQVIRPEVKPDNIINALTYFIFWIDNPPINCLPSLHCAVCMLFSLTAFSSKKVTTNYKILITFLGILIMISTLVIKQHVFIDLVTGDILMTICYIVMASNKNILNKIEKLLKL